MGLDMYLNKRLADNTSLENIGGWRKHANLHGYMESLYRARGGTDDFNCIPLELTKDDCEKILALSKDREEGFETAEGFFWGQSYPEHNEETIEHMEEALEAIKLGYTIYYDSWW
jgi:hypothetical protein